MMELEGTGNGEWWQDLATALGCATATGPGPWGKAKWAWKCVLWQPDLAPRGHAEQFFPFFPRCLFGLTAASEWQKGVAKAP